MPAHNRLPLGALRVFEAVASALNFSAAAEVLNVTPLQISTLASFLQMWLLPRVRAFRRKFSDIELRFHTSRELIDFSRTSMHVAIRFGHGNYPNLHCEKLLDDWLVPVASPELIKQYGMLERGADLSKYPLLESDDEPWSVWRKARWI